jgi:predicted TIM-barrel fold metal-dependent hydrolase
MEDDCTTKLSRWIVEVKKQTYEKYVKSNDNAQDLQNYREALESLEKKLNMALYKEDTEELSKLGWPEELMNCISNMDTNSELTDMIHESFVIHHFNRSPIHEDELRNENAGLR